MRAGQGFQTPSADDEVLSEVVRRLTEAYEPLRVYLFGSVARGDAAPDSDYDILVLVPDSASQWRLEPTLAYRGLQGLRIAKDVSVWTRSEFEKRLHLKASFPSTVVRERKLLYAA